MENSHGNRPVKPRADEQYAVDVNLIDSDFFERANVQGVYAALAYSITDGIIGTFRYGYANRINKELGTGGINPDLPVLNPLTTITSCSST